jgi:hypothetical protein
VEGAGAAVGDEALSEPLVGGSAAEESDGIAAEAIPDARRRRRIT